MEGPSSPNTDSSPAMFLFPVDVGKLEATAKIERKVIKVVHSQDVNGHTAPFPYEHAQGRITMISLPPAHRKHI